MFQTIRLVFETHQSTGKWLDRNHTKFEFNLWNRKCLNVSVPQNTQKRGSELLTSLKRGRIVAHENLHVSDMRSLRTFWASNNCRTGRRLRSFTQSTWQDISASLKLVTWRVSDVALDLCFLRSFCRLFQRLLKICFLSHVPSPSENTPLTGIIPKEYFGNYVDRHFCGWCYELSLHALYFHKARCVNQLERALSRNFIIKHN